MALILAASIAGVPEASAASEIMPVPWGNPPTELPASMARHVQGMIALPAYGGIGSAHWVNNGIEQHVNGQLQATLGTILYSIDEDGTLPTSLVYNTGSEHLTVGSGVRYTDTVENYINGPNEQRYDILNRFRSDVGVSSSGVPKNYLRSARQYPTWLYPRSYENKMTVGEAWKDTYWRTWLSDASGFSTSTLVTGYEAYSDDEVNGIPFGNFDMIKVTRTNTFSALHGDYEIRSEKTYNHNYTSIQSQTTQPPDNWSDSKQQWWEGTNLMAEVISDFALQGDPEARWADQYEEIIRVKTLYDTSPVIQVRMMPHVGILFAPLSGTNSGPDFTQPMIANVAPYWAPFTFPILGSSYHDIIKPTDAEGNPINPIIPRAQHIITKNTQTKSKFYHWSTLNGQLTIDPANYDNNDLIVTSGGPAQSYPTTRELLERQVVWHGNFAALLPAGEAGKGRTPLSELGLVVAPDAPNPTYWLVTFEVSEFTGTTDDPSLLSLHVKVGQAITTPVPVISQ